MKYGIAAFATDYSIRPDDLAREAEARGFESVWFAEHTHIPVSVRSRFPGGPELPKEYSHTLDLFVVLTAAAMATTRLRIVSGVCLLVQRDPIVTAKEVATLDLLSKGRLEFGIGGGWNAPEMANHGTEFKSRWKVLRERVLAMKEIWTRDEAEFHGEFVDFDPIRAYPKPLQKPHPPILMGGDGPTTFDRVLEYCDGWCPIAGRSPNLAEKISVLRERAAQAGRDPKALSVSIYWAPPERAEIDRLETAGADRVVFNIGAADRDTALRQLDQYAELITNDSE